MPSIDRAGETIFYDRTGNAPDAIVFLHNLFAERSIFAAVTPELWDRHSTVAIDLRGHGQSSARSEFTIDDLIEDVIAVLDRERIADAVFAGVSLGATIAMEIALRHPSRVRALVLMAATARAASPTDVIANRTVAAVTRLFGMNAVIATGASHTLYGASYRGRNADAVKRWVHSRKKRDRLAIARSLEAWTARASLRERLVAIDRPTLVVIGEEDTAHPLPLGEEIQRGIRGAELARVEGAGHTIPLEQPAVVAQILASFVRTI